MRSGRDTSNSGPFVAGTVRRSLVRRAIVSLCVLGIIVVAAGAAVTVFNRGRFPDIPYPVASEVVLDHYGPLAFYRQVTLKIPEEFFSLDLITFYSAWARADGWRRTKSDEDGWSSEEWESFVDGTRNSINVDQFLARWVSGDDKWSLRIALFRNSYPGDSVKPTHTLVLWIEPFHMN